MGKAPLIAVGALAMLLGAAPPSPRARAPIRLEPQSCTKSRRAKKTRNKRRRRRRRGATAKPAVRPAPPPTPEEAPPPGSAELAVDPAVDALLPPEAGAGWRQILNVPRIGGRLTAITVDAQDPDRIFVGTEAGTLILSDDGGVTWTEIDIDARVIQKKNIGLPAPGLPRLGKVTKGNFGVVVDPPWRQAVDRITVSSVANPFPVKPAFFWAGFFATTRSPKVRLLRDVTRFRTRETQPVKRIALCPGGLYEVIVATSDAVYGSMDNGLTYVRLFANAGKVFLDHAICSPANPDFIAIATNIGLFLSDDGGLTFDQDLTAWPGKKSTAVAYAPPRFEGETFLFSAAKSDLFAGDPSTSEGLVNIYPTDPSTAPWRTIRWIAADADGAIYLATDDGARVSFDRGSSWKTVARTLLSRQAVGQVEIGEGPSGKKRVAMLVNVRPRSFKGKPVSGLHDSIVYASDDGGESFFPFFSGLSRRTYRQMSSVRSTPTRPAGWWIATSAEVWTNYPGTPPEAIDPESVGWARRRLAATPRLDEVLLEVLHATKLSTRELDGLGQRVAALGLMPKLEVYLRANLPRRAGNRDLRYNASDAANRQLVLNRRSGSSLEDFYGLVQLTWDTGWLNVKAEDLGGDRRRLHYMRRQVERATEDAYHERSTLLHDLAQGRSHPMEIETLKTRIFTLEAILATWMRHPLPGTES